MGFEEILVHVDLTVASRSRVWLSLAIARRLQRILVAWDGSREAARAVHDSLPLLQQACEVTLLAIDPTRQGHIGSGADPAAITATSKDTESPPK